MHYYHDRYGYYKSDRYYNINRYIPSFLAKVPVLFFAFIVSAGKYFYYLPIRFCALFEFRKELRRLAKKNNKDNRGIT